MSRKGLQRRSLWPMLAPSCPPSTPLVVSPAGFCRERRLKQKDRAEIGMANVVIVGMQWGDEGKGKIVDLLCPAFDGVVRYQGGHNAGHTVKFRDRHFSLQLIPSGILHPDMLCVLGNGMVVAPDAMLSELARLYEAGVRFDGRLFVSNRAHVLLPCHAILDQAREEAARRRPHRHHLPGHRPGLREQGLALRPADGGPLRARPRGAPARAAVAHPGRARRAWGGEPLPVARRSTPDMCREWAERLKPSLRDTEQLLNGWIKEGEEPPLRGRPGLACWTSTTAPIRTSPAPTRPPAAPAPAPACRPRGSTAPSASSRPTPRGWGAAPSRAS